MSEIGESEQTELHKEFEVVVAGREIGGETTQPNEEDASWGMPDDGIVPPTSPESLANLSALNGTRRSIIEAIARNTVGLGLDAQPASRDTTREDAQERIDELLDVLDALAGRDRRMDRPSFVELLYAVKMDEEEVGQGGIEVSRNQLTGDIDGLFYVPGKRLRRLKDRSGWLLVAPDGDETKAVRFVNFGERVEYDDEGNVATENGKAKFRTARNELLIFRLHSSETRDYGTPRDVALIPEYYADKLAAQSNIGFFDASGTPPTLVFVGVEDKGASQVGPRVSMKIPERTVSQIGRTVRSDAQSRHKVAILPLPPGGKVEKVELGKVSDKDLGFVNFRSDLRKRQLTTFRVSPIFVADTGDAGRFTAEVERAITLEQVFDPEQQRYEKRLHRTLFTDLGYDDLKPLFTRLAVESDAAKREGAESMATVSAITNAEFRKAHGYGPLPEAETDDAEEAAKLGLVPKGWNKQLVVGGANVKARPSEKTTADPDDRGKKDGIGGRPPTSDPDE